MTEEKIAQQKKLIEELGMEIVKSEPPMYLLRKGKSQAWAKVSSRRVIVYESAGIKEDGSVVPVKLHNIPNDVVEVIHAGPDFVSMALDREERRVKMIHNF